eukprot:TRINITY_DN47369_c0_g1_i2.p1 TRINITY_DN47369_c0_g1~~TRINITY_DN47369_c0_g1_i2.p1  ORF type:complete len:400 (-),score=49.29 TRINITY_DN47369_c0_g1_i2:11-1210(-)
MAGWRLATLLISEAIVPALTGPQAAPPPVPTCDYWLKETASLSEAAATTLANVCSSLPAELKSKPFVAVHDLSSADTAEDVSSALATLADRAADINVVPQWYQCEGRKVCLPVSGCLSGATAAALALMLLRLGAKLATYTNIDLARFKGCEEGIQRLQVMSLMAPRGSEPTLESWIDSAGSAAKTGAACGVGDDTLPSAVMDSYGLDKGSKVHQYTRVYDSLLGPRRCTNQLAQGYPPGSSLKAWGGIFPTAMITGIDVDPVAVDRFLASRQTRGSDVSRMHAHTMDSGNATLARRLLGSQRYDVVIDDGLHKLAKQRATLRALWPLLRVGGLYIIEDVFDEFRKTNHHLELALSIDHAIAVTPRSVTLDWMVITTKTSDRRPTHRPGPVALTELRRAR